MFCEIYLIMGVIKNTKCVVSTHITHHIVNRLPFLNGNEHDILPYLEMSIIDSFLNILP